MIQDIPKLYTALAEWLACVLFVRLLPQRYNAAKTAGILAAALPLFGLVQWLIGIVPLSLWIPGMIVALVLMYATIWLCCRLNFCDTGFWWALAFTLAEFVASLEWQLYSFGASKMPGRWWIQGLFLLAFYGGGFGVFLRLEQKRLRDKAPLHMTRRESISAAVIAICTFLISNISYVTTNTPFSGRMTTEIFWIRTLVDFAGVAVLLSMQDRWQDMQTQHELTAIQTLLKRQYEQYRISRDNSEAINRKYHDLKHQIQVIRMESDAARREEYLSQLEKGMQSLGVNQHTGNDVLDTILSDKQLYVYGSHDRFNAPIFCVNDYVCWSAPVEDLSEWRYEGVIYRKKQDPKNPLGYHLLFAPDVCQGPDGRYYLYYAFDFLGIMSVAVCDTYVAKVDKDVIYDDAHDGARSTDQVAATNQLTFAQGDVTYLSRADGFANYAEATAAPANHSLSAQALADYASAATFDAAKYDDPNAVMPTTGANNGLKLADLSGVAYDDPKWEQLLDELTVNDLFSLTADGGYHTVGVESIGLSATEDCDGPTGVHSNYNPAAGPSYPGSVMLACTWNQPLAKARGEQIAKECAEINCAGWYAPAMNIHRSAFGGRNFEYYSECGVLSGLTAAAEVSGATENGLICYVKHFAFNDQDNYRQNNICTWLNEQSAREIYLKAFEQPLKAGGMGVMTSMNAVGPVWAGGCKALLTNILRDEWGFHGAVITDAVVSAWYMDGNLAIRTGGTKMLAFNITNEFYRDLNSVGTVTAMRNAAHGTLYALANSFAVTRAVSVPKWVKTTYAVDAVVAIILVAWEICAIRKYRKAKKEDEDTEQ